MTTILTIDAIDPFRTSLSERGLSEHTIKAYSTDVKMFFRELELVSLPADQLHVEVPKWMKLGKANRLAPKTQRRRKTSIVTFAEYYGVKDLLDRYKLPKLSPHIPHPLPDLNRDLDAMFKQCETAEHHALVALLGLMGLRLFEALQCRLADFDFKANTLTVYGKNGRVRFLPLTPRASTHIVRQYLDRQVFGHEMLLTYSDRHARRIITDLGVKANISRPISSHDLRATFATLVYGKTKDILALQIWLGHESVSTTQLYVAVAMDALRAAGEI